MQLEVFFFFLANCSQRQEGREVEEYLKAPVLITYTSIEAFKPFLDIKTGVAEDLLRRKLPNPAGWTERNDINNRKIAAFILFVPSVLRAISKKN